MEIMKMNEEAKKGLSEKVYKKERKKLNASFDVSSKAAHKTKFFTI